MSKIGRKPINVSGVTISIKGQEVHYKGPKSSGVHELPSVLQAQSVKDALVITPTSGAELNRETKTLWGLHRSLLDGKLKGAQQEFERSLEINGLGFKAAKAGDKLVFSLGFSHKIDFLLPKEVSVDIDKTGQQLKFKSCDKELVGLVCSKIRDLRVPEPYKGTGIKHADEVIVRKAGKAKASA